MAVNRATKTATETDLEVRTAAALKKAFPWLDEKSFKHQIKFTFSFKQGRKTIEVDAQSQAKRNEARLDILIEKDGKPLMVVELKRHNLELTSDDEAQGLSYARMLNPPAPLVIISNGTDVRVLETRTGQAWTPQTESDEAFEALIKKAARVAQADLRHAIQTLMGTTPTVWMQGVRELSNDTISELTATSEQPARPFADNFLVPRAATFHLLKEVDAGARLLVLLGTPLAGKSNVLRQLVLQTEPSESVATLFLEAGVGGGIFQSIADALRRSLEWPVTPQEAREWLITLSHAGGAKLIVAVDKVDPRDAGTRRDIEMLSSQEFGDSLAIVLAVDEAAAPSLLENEDGRGASPIGRRAKLVKLSSLSDREFSLLEKVLGKHDITLMEGAKLAPEYREPWVLRAVCGAAIAAVGRRPDTGLALPSLLGLDLIWHVRERFDAQAELRRRFQALAKALLEDVSNANYPPELILEVWEECILSRETALKYLEHNDLEALVGNGYVRPSMHDTAGPTLLVRLPELLASEASRLMAKELLKRAATDMEDAATWLAETSARLPLGELVGAQCLLDAAPKGVPIGVISHLVNMPPQREGLAPGRYELRLPYGKSVEMEVESDGALIVDGERHEGDEPQVTYTDLQPWLILSHVASAPFVVKRDGKEEREDPDLLLMIGQAHMPLRANRGSQPSMRFLPMFDVTDTVSVVDPGAGIVEPITMGMLNYVVRESETAADAWVAKAVSSDAVALLHRMNVALGMLASMEGHSRSDWAHRTRVNVLAPRLVEVLKQARGAP